MELICTQLLWKTFKCANFKKKNESQDQITSSKAQKPWKTSLHLLVCNEVKCEIDLKGLITESALLL